MRARRTDLIILALFVATFACTLVIAWRSLGTVRATAAETDRRIRTLGWATLAYAAEHGVFPLSAEELESFGIGPEAIAIASSEQAWPSTRIEALGGDVPSSLDDAFHSILVVFGDYRTMPPYLKPDGLPTTVGTSPQVNAWLESFGKELESRERAARPQH